METLPLEVALADGTVLRGMRHEGEGPGVLLIHGLASNARLWDGVLEALAAQGYSVAAIDQRGHGRSDQAASGYSIEQLAADDAAVLETLGWEHPIVVGQSLGANVALALAASSCTPKGLVLVDGGFIDLSARYTAWLACAAELAPPDFSHLRSADVVELLRAQHPDWTEQAILGMTGAWSDVDGQFTPYLTRDHHLTLLRSLYDHPPHRDAAQVTTPTSIIASAGAETDVVKRRAVEHFAEALADCKIVWRDQADHDFHAQYPDETAAIILELDG